MFGDRRGQTVAAGPEPAADSRVTATLLFFLNRLYKKRLLAVVVGFAFRDCGRFCCSVFMPNSTDDALTLVL